MRYDFSTVLEICQPERLAQELHELLLVGDPLPLSNGSNDQDSRALRRSVRAMLRVFMEQDTVRMNLLVRQD